MSESSLVGPQHFYADKYEAKELVIALSHLPADQRIDWLRLCCLKASPPGGARIYVIRSSGEVMDVISDFNTICGQNGMSLEWATGLAEHLLRSKLARDFVAENGGERWLLEPLPRAHIPRR